MPNKHTTIQIILGALSTAFLLTGLCSTITNRDLIDLPLIAIGLVLLLALLIYPGFIEK